MVETEFLAKFGFNPKEFERFNPVEHRRNLETMTRHVYEDLPLSSLYYYQIEGERIISLPSGFELIIAKNEREGLYDEGLKKAFFETQKNPNKFIFLYSPPGVVDFKREWNATTGENYYKIGQLCFIWWDGEKFNNLALSVSSEGEWFIKELLGEEFIVAGDDFGGLRRIITNPVSSDSNIDDLIQRWENSEDGAKPVYRNVRDQTFSLREVVRYIKLSLSNYPTYIEDKTLKALQEYEITQERIIRIYLEHMRGYMMERGFQKMPLGGSCGGQVVSLSEIDQILGSTTYTTSESILDSLSTAFRELTQSDRYPDYICPGCGKKIKGELKNEPETWKTECPYCRHKFYCASTWTKYRGKNLEG